MRISYTTKKFLVCFFRNKKFIYFFPFVILHELSHWIFFWLAGTSKEFRLFFAIHSIGFTQIKDEFSITWKQSFIMLVVPIAPLIPFIMTIYLCFKYIYILPPVASLYGLIGAIICLIPSRQDIKCFKFYLKLTIDGPNDEK